MKAIWLACCACGDYGLLQREVEGRDVGAQVLRVGDLDGLVSMARAFPSRRGAAVIAASLFDTEDVRNRNMREESSWILRRIQGCTACVCYNDEVASNLAATCLEQKIKVPDKMSIIGIDDSDLANYCEVPLASVKNPIRELAKKAAEEILDLMQEKEVPDSVELKPEIINRSSVKIIK